MRITRKFVDKRLAMLNENFSMDKLVYSINSQTFDRRMYKLVANNSQSISAWVTLKEIDMLIDAMMKVLELMKNTMSHSDVANQR